MLQWHTLPHNYSMLMPRSFIRLRHFSLLGCVLLLAACAGDVPPPIAASVVVPTANGPVVAAPATSAPPPSTAVPGSTQVVDATNAYPVAVDYPATIAAQGATLTALVPVAPAASAEASAAPQQTTVAATATQGQALPTAPALGSATVAADGTAGPRPTSTRISLFPSPSPAQPITTTVFNGGNVRQQPNVETGLVLDQLNANETVTLRLRTPDDQWVAITNERNVNGWVSSSLLFIDPAVLPRLPIDTVDPIVSTTPLPTYTPQPATATPTTTAATAVPTTPSAASTAATVAPASTQSQ